MDKLDFNGLESGLAGISTHEARRHPSSWDLNLAESSVYFHPEEQPCQKPTQRLEITGVQVL